MPFEDRYRRQVSLLIRALPLVAAEPCFALKGGTAINLFWRDLPRLSVDIDLTYVPVAPRAESLAAIDAAMRRIEGRLNSAIPAIRIHRKEAEGAIIRLTAATPDAQIKIEVTPVLRGCMDEPELRRVVAAVEDEFGFAEIPVVSFADLYGGKIVAALDRQHPRDLFDVRDLLANEGIDDRLRQAIIIYLLSHARPVGELLAVRPKDITAEYVQGFAGMTREPVSRDDLIATRDQLVDLVITNMPSHHRRFLLSFERGAPEWHLLGVAGADLLPAIRWRQQNLDSLPAHKRQALVDHLASILEQD